MTELESLQEAYKMRELEIAILSDALLDLYLHPQSPKQLTVDVIDGLVKENKLRPDTRLGTDETPILH